MGNLLRSNPSTKFTMDNTKPASTTVGNFPETENNPFVDFLTIFF